MFFADARACGITLCESRTWSQAVMVTKGNSSTKLPAYNGDQRRGSRIWVQWRGADLGYLSLYEAKLNQA